MRIIIVILLLFTSLKAIEDLNSLEAGQYLALSNAVIVFTSQDGLSSGVYRFTNIDTEMLMYNLPLQYHFEPLTDKTNVFMIIDMGYSNTHSDRDINVSDKVLNTSNQLQSYVFGVGIGLRYKATEHSELQVGGEFLYSRLGLFEREGGGLDGSVSNFFDEMRDTYSYKILAEYIYHREINKHKVYTRFNYKLYKSFNEIKIGEIVGDVVGDVLSLRSQTSVASVTFSYETNPLYRYQEMSLTLEPYIKGNYIWGDMAEVAQINGYGTAGLSFYWNTPEKSAYIYRYFIEPSISKGYGIEGLNLGIGFSLDF